MNEKPVTCICHSKPRIRKHAVYGGEWYVECTCCGRCTVELASNKAGAISLWNKRILREKGVLA